MSKRVLFALLAGYSIRAFQKGPIWIGVKRGLSAGILKNIKSDFPEIYEKAIEKFTPEQRERIETKLRSV